MQREAKVLSGGGNFLNFGKAVDRAAFCRLGEGHRAALRPMHAASLFRQNGFAQSLCSHFRVIPRHECQLGPTGIKFGSIAFIFVDMRDRMAKYRFPRLRQRGKDQGIGSRPKRDQIDRRLRGFKHISDVPHSLSGGVIGAVGQGIAHIRRIERRHDIGVHGAGVVRCKIHRLILNYVVFPFLFGHFKFRYCPALHRYACLMHRLRRATAQRVPVRNFFALIQSFICASIWKPIGMLFNGFRGHSDTLWHEVLSNTILGASAGLIVEKAAGNAGEGHMSGVGIFELVETTAATAVTERFPFRFGHLGKRHRLPKFWAHRLSV